MKTIKSFLLGLILTALSIASFIYAITLFNYTTITYTELGKEEPISFTTVFLASGILLVFAAMHLLTLSIGSFKLFIKYYNNYTVNKRDRDIKRALVDAKYSQFYKDIDDAPTLELKEAVVNTFYNDKHNIHTDTRQDFSSFMQGILKG